MMVRSDAMTREQAINLLIKHPARFAHMLGFTKLGDLHNDWIIDMVKGKDDKTLEASRGTYKTTCVSFALALIVILLPNSRTLFMRKTDDDIKEVIKQVQKILLDPHTQYIVYCIYGVNLKLTVQSATEISTNLTTDTRGTNQLVGIGSKASLTGKHFDRIFTDDIINVQDRVSKAERERVKIVYQELQNIKNRGGRIFNTLTPWHPDDASTLMPNISRYDCYHPQVKEIITDEELAKIKESMVASLFAANYELRHIASEDVIFTDPQTGAGIDTAIDGIMHVDSAFYGEDFTAWGVMAKHDGKYYLYGRCVRKHVEDCYADIMADYERFRCAKLYNESNADKGFVAKELRKMGAKVILYAEKENKYIKIVTHLKAIWKDLVFVDGTDKEYINQICDYFEDAEHDDAPDDAACLARLLYGKREGNYQSIYM
jgi:hypothetical protein